MYEESHITWNNGEYNKYEHRKNIILLFKPIAAFVFRLHNLEETEKKSEIHRIFEFKGQLHPMLIGWNKTI